ncbi:phage virion morphogenesis protein [Psychrobacter aquaticus]|uniref:Virion morphogenesis protein n=1 Tax=Psychrobacter aquaticus CMS 56 TaxID=1354303 RepID=U4TBQ8_9GAMM|nr:phage virion morphogenesis protein [Psychrobacter aquaticus]ERL56149.1 virion morphogenesis protein [Psychrobacter aquaticus CMS 56]
MVIADVEGMEQITAQLLRILERTGDLSPLMEQMGEHMINSTHDNFETSTSPDGTRWESNSAVTLAAMLGKSHTNKSGRLNRRGANKIMSKRPLIANNTLMQSIHYEAASDSVTIGTNMVYGAMMHFGGSKADYPYLWGDIPARNYLGASEEDVDILMNMATEYLINN